MGRALLILTDQETREKAVRWIRQARVNSRITFQGPRRTIPQNDKMWAMLTQLAQYPWIDGQMYQPDDYKDNFLHALRRGAWMPAEGGGMVPIRMRSSDLSIEEMSDMIELILENAARRGLDIKEPENVISE